MERINQETKKRAKLRNIWKENETTQWILRTLKYNRDTLKSSTNVFENIEESEGAREKYGQEF